MTLTSGVSEAEFVSLAVKAEKTNQRDSFHSVRMRKKHTYLLGAHGNVVMSMTEHRHSQRLVKFPES
jgi:hypothetical protein